MIGLNPTEREAITNKSEAIGAFLENLGKSDLATLTEREWLDFLGHAFTLIANETSRIVGEECPF